ncbi:MAG: DUF1572 family protein [Planctomycetota bacterium]
MSAMLEAIIATFEYQKRLGTGALRQLDERQLHETVGYDGNTPAVIVRHLAGNFRSRFTNFLTTDGEKPDRDRDSEFIDDGLDKAGILQRWEQGWSVLLDTLGALREEDLERAVTIRGEPHTVPRALLRALDHGAYHTGQLVLIAKMLRGDAWDTLTVPRGGTAELHDRMGFDPTNG